MLLIQPRTAALGVSMWKMIVLIILPADPNMDSQLRDGPNTRLQTVGSGLLELALQVNLWLLYTHLYVIRQPFWAVLIQLRPKEGKQGLKPDGWKRYWTQVLRLRTVLGDGGLAPTIARWCSPRLRGTDERGARSLPLPGKRTWWAARTASSGSCWALWKTPESCEPGHRRDRFPRRRGCGFLLRAEEERKKEKEKMFRGQRGCELEAKALCGSAAQKTTCCKFLLIIQRIKWSRRSVPASTGRRKFNLDFLHHSIFMLTDSGVHVQEDSTSFICACAISSCCTESPVKTQTWRFFNSRGGGGLSWSLTPPDYMTSKL